MKRAAAYVEFAIARGEDKSFPMVHVISASDSTPINLTGWTIRIKVKRKDGTVVVEKAATLGATLADGSTVAASAGGYTWGLTNAESNITPGLCKIDIFRVDAGVIRAMAIGTIELVDDVRYGTP